MSHWWGNCGVSTYIIRALKYDEYMYGYLLPNLVLHLKKPLPLLRLGLLLLLNSVLNLGVGLGRVVSTYTISTFYLPKDDSSFSIFYMTIIKGCLPLISGLSSLGLSSFWAWIWKIYVGLKGHHLLFHILRVYEGEVGVWF